MRKYSLMKKFYTLILISFVVFTNAFAQCEFFNCFAAQSDCLDQTGQDPPGSPNFAQAWGEINNPGSMGYIVETPFGTFGPFDYYSNFPFASTTFLWTMQRSEEECAESFNLTVRDYEFQSCFVELVYEPEHCCCKIENLQVDTICVGPGEYQLTIDFNYIPGNPNQTIFWVSLGDVQNWTYFFNETYQLSDLPITIGPFTADCMTEFDVVVATGGGIDHCLDYIHLPAICCGANECTIEDLVGIVTPCDAMEEYEVLLDFYIDNPGSQGFEVYHDYCQCTESYQYSDLPILLGPFPGDCMTDINIEVTDTEFGCIAGLSIEAPCCQAPPPCSLSDLELTISCIEEDSMTVIVDFDVENGSEDGFELWINDSLIAVVDYDDLPYTTPALFVDCSMNYHFRILDMEDEECEMEDTIEEPCCTMNLPMFSNVSIDTTCQGAGAFNLTVAFDVTHPGEEGWMLQVNASYAGPFDYSQLPHIVGPFQMDCEGSVEITLSDKQYSESKVIRELEEICCLTSNLEELTLGIVKYRLNQHSLYLENGTTSMVEWTLSTIHGQQLVGQQTLQPGQIREWVLPMMPSGIVLLNCTSPEGTYVYRIFVP